MTLKIGALFAGYGGLDLAVSSVLDAEPVWFSEYDKGPSKILAHRFPGVPNHGDITKIDWSQVEPVDILTGGSPCQDLSHAGARKGMTEGTRSNLWVAMREAIAQLRPGLVVWENVGGAFSANASSEVEPCAGCVGDGSGTHLRALGRVLGDLSSLGYDARWVALRAADVGAPHGRLRVFVTAYPNGEGRGSLGRLYPIGRDADGRDRADGSGSQAQPAALLPTPRIGGLGDNPSERRRNSPGLESVAVQHLLPTPAVNDMGASYTPDEWDAWTDRMKAEHGNGNGHGHGKSLHIEAARLLSTPRAEERMQQNSADSGMALSRQVTLIPTPSVADSTGGHERRGGARGDELLLKGLAKEGHLDRLLPTPMVGSSNPAAHGQISGDYRAAMAEAFQQWGQYEAAIQRWESLTRPAPAPTETGPKGNPRLSAAFSEWMMGLPAGWVTDVPGITRNEALKALGNGVVPQQCAAALRYLLAASEVGA